MAPTVGRPSATAKNWPKAFCVCLSGSTFRAAHSEASESAPRRRSPTFRDRFSMRSAFRRPTVSRASTFLRRFGPLGDPGQGSRALRSRVRSHLRGRSNRADATSRRVPLSPRVRRRVGRAKAQACPRTGDGRREHGSRAAGLGRISGAGGDAIRGCSGPRTKGTPCWSTRVAPRSRADSRAPR